MTLNEEIDELSFEENMTITIGLSKGTYLGIEPSPTKNELIDELKEEMEVVDKKEAEELRKMVLHVQKMTDKEFVEFYKNIPALELKNGSIQPPQKEKQ